MEDTFNDPCHVVHFFFDLRVGDGIGNNFEGLLRSLLLQLCEKFPRAMSEIPALQSLLDRTPSTRASNLSTLGLNELRKAPIDGPEAVPGQILILLDGLDEYAGEKAELVVFINALCSKGLKICLASRPDPPFRTLLRTSRHSRCMF